MTSASSQRSALPRLGLPALMLLGILALALALAPGSDASDGGAQAREPKKPERMETPNVVMIIADDQSPRTVIPEAMPNLFFRLMPRATTFDDYIVTTPLCCPSRATLLTGQYGHNNGVLRNFYPDLKEEQNVLPSWLQRAGYNTAHVGKFLNSYEANKGGAAAVAPGWDLWFTELEKRRYYNWKASKNGKVRHYGYGDKDHVTHVTTEFATRWTNRLARKKDPFYMQVDYYAPHTSTGRDTRCASGPVPEPEDEHLFDTYVVPQLPNYNEEDIGDKPAEVQSRAPLTADDTIGIERRLRCTLEANFGIDRGIGELMDTLKQRKELDDTVIIYTADNGFFYGEHRIAKGKPDPYEENINMPFTMYVPPKFRNRADLVPTSGQPVANIDVAPTILDLADTEPCRTKKVCRVMDGRSMMPLFDGTGGWPSPRGIGIELYDCDYRGVRYDHQVYFQYSQVTAEGCQPTDTELYNLELDPYQLLNLTSAGLGDEYEADEDRLRQMMINLGDCAGIEGRDPFPASGHYCQ